MPSPAQESTISPATASNLASGRVAPKPRCGRLAFTLATTLALATGCTDDAGPECETDTECAGTLVCTSNICVASTLCERNAECDNGLLCDGAETCDPSSSAAGADGCVGGAPTCMNVAGCDESMGGACCDEDADGDPAMACGGNDCDDSDATRYSTAVEVCEGSFADQDCNPDTDGCGVGDGPIDCPDAGAETIYTINAFNIPEAPGSDPDPDDVFGLDLDGEDMACNVMDAAGSVDNEWINLATALTVIDSDLDYRGELNSAIASCGVVFEVSVRRGARCGIVEIRDTADSDRAVSGGAFFVRIDDDVMTGRPTFADVRWPFSVGSTTGTAAIRGVEARFSATFNTGGLEDIVLAGEQPFSELRTMATMILGVINDGCTDNCVPSQNLDFALMGVVDTPSSAGVCDDTGSVSMGFVGTATILPPVCI